MIIESFVIKDFGHFSVFSKCAEAVNEIASSDICLQNSSIAVHGRDIRMLTCCKIIFLKGEMKRMSLIWKYIKDEHGERDYSKTDVYAVSPELLDDLWRGHEEPRKG